MASNNCTNTFRSLICIVDIGNIYKGTCRILIFPRYIWAYKAGAVISDVATHFEPCYRLIRPYIYLFNSLMTARQGRMSRVYEYLPGTEIKGPHLGAFFRISNPTCILMLLKLPHFLNSRNGLGRLLNARRSIAI